MGFSFETLQKVLTFAHTLAEIAQLVEHQLPKLRAAGSNPVFRSKANRRMMQIIRFFVPGQDRCKLVCIRDWMGNKKGCAQHNGLLSGAPAASARECRRPNPVRASIPQAPPPHRKFLQFTVGTHPRQKALQQGVLPTTEQICCTVSTHPSYNHLQQKVPPTVNCRNQSTPLTLKENFFIVLHMIYIYN